ncbi:pyocin S6 family toxin immunity protein [Pseudomonas sp. HLT2-19-2]
MKYELKFQIYGIPENGDLAVFEVDLSRTVTTDALMPIMAWHEVEDAMASHLLSAGQVAAIENLAMIELPKDLMLYLSSYE